MKTLVTGAGGFVGAALCQALLVAEEAVVALWHRNRQRLDALAGMGGLTLAQGDIHDLEYLVDLCRGVDAVCHLAVLPPGAAAAAKTNVQGTENVVEACRRAGVERLVYASSMSVYDFLAPEYLPVDERHPCRPLQEYGREKLQGETLCLAAGQSGELQVCALRLAGIFGPGKSHGAAYAFTRAIMADEPVAIEVERAIDLLYLDDAVQALQRALATAETGVFNIGSGAHCMLSELAAKIAARLGREPRIDYQEQGGTFVLDITRAQSLLGYRPMALDTALARFVPWVRQDAAR